MTEGARTLLQLWTRTWVDYGKIQVFVPCNTGLKGKERCVAECIQNQKIEGFMKLRSWELSALERFPRAEVKKKSRVLFPLPQYTLPFLKVTL